MRTGSKFFATAVVAGLACNGSDGFAAESTSVHLEDQWYTGSLLSPSGALSHQGMFGFEPYLVFTEQNGKFGADGGHRSVASPERRVTSTTLVKYALTDHLSLQLLPAFSYGWSNGDTSSGINLGDLPVELQYRFVDASDERLRPALTAFLGMNLPLGEYDHLARTSNGVGTGAWGLRAGLLSQSAYLLRGKSLRLRAYATAVIPLATVNVHSDSVYDTDKGFEGQAAVGTTARIGASLELGLTKAWVLALDAVRDFEDGNRLHGHRADGSRLDESTGATGDWTIAPAVEYNLSSHYGLIAGAAVTVAGHNTKSEVTPQLAFNCVF